MLRKLLKNKKGFTMVELLATIVILGILFSVGIASVQRVINKSHETYDNKQLELFSGAARSYFADNQSKLPKEIYESTKVYLRVLRDGKYIGVIRDSNGVDCSNDESYVEVIKYSKSKYSYEPYLVCGGNILGNSSSGSKNATIVFDSVSSYSTYFKQKVYRGTDNNTVTGTSSPNTFEALGQEVNPDGSVYYTNDKVNIKFSISTNVGIGSYQYYIYKKIGNDYKEYKRSEAVEVSDESKKIDEEVSLSKDDISDGTYKLKAVIYDIKGHRTSAESNDSIVLDTEKPTCNVTASGINGESGWFKEEKADITIDIKDDNPYLYSLSNNDQTNYYMSAYKKIKGTKLQGNTTDEGISWNGKVVDRAGNVGECTSENIMVDTKAPTCTLSGGSEEWKKDDVTITATCTDNESGCVEQKKTKEYKTTSSMKVINTNKAGLEGIGLGGSVVDNAGNVGICEANQVVKIDKEPPICTVTATTSDGNSYTSGTVANQSVSVKRTCSDNGSGCVQGEVISNFDSDTTSVSDATQFSDVVGNTTKCDTVNVIINKEKPTCSLQVGSGTEGKINGTFTGWYISDVTVKFKTKSANIKRSIITENANTATAFNSVNAYDEINNSSSYDVKTNTSHDGKMIYGYVEDEFGNIGKCSLKVKVDKTGPTCNSKTYVDNEEHTTGWTNKDVTVAGICSDSNSGCYSPKVETVVTSEGDSYRSPGAVRDNAGHSTYCSAAKVQIDKTPPVCTMDTKCVAGSTSSGDWCGPIRDDADNIVDDETTRILATCADSISGCNSYLQDTNGVCNKDTCPLTETANYQFRVSGWKYYDKAGNVGECSSIKSKDVDKKPPSINWSDAAGTPNCYSGQPIHTAGGLEAYNESKPVEIKCALTFDDLTSDGKQGSGVDLSKFSRHEDTVCGCTTTPTALSQYGWSGNYDLTGNSNLTDRGSGTYQYITENWAYSRKIYIKYRICDKVGNCATTPSRFFNIKVNNGKGNIVANDKCHSGDNTGSDDGSSCTGVKNFPIGHFCNKGDDSHKLGANQVCSD